MRKLTAFLSGALPLLAAAACSKLSVDAPYTAAGHREGGSVCVSLEAKSTLPGIKTCILFALDQNGTVAYKDSIPCQGSGLTGKVEWKMSCGTYRVWGIANGGKEATQKLWESTTADQIASLAFPLNEQERGNALSLLTINGNDDSFTLDSDQKASISLTGKPMMAKICLRNTINKTSYYTMPARGPVNIRCLEAVLLNVADSVAIDQQRTFEIKNSTSGKTLDLLNECTQTAGSGIEIEPEGTRDENLTLYCFPDAALDAELILAVAFELGGECVRWYNIPIGRVETGYEYSVNNLIIMKEGATTPFSLTPTSVSSTQTSAREWETAQEEGLEGSFGKGSIQYSLSHNKVSREDPPENWTCDFAQIYGSACVTGADQEKVRVTGAGKHWVLHPVADGYTTLSLYDGLNSASEPLCIGNSITYRWTDCNGDRWDDSKTLYTYQRCSLKVDSCYGTVKAEMDGSAFSNCGASFDGNLVCSDPEGEGRIVLSDYFENKTASFPGEIASWDFFSLPIERSRNDSSITVLAPLTATITFPFNIDESNRKVKMLISDPNGDMEKYDISITGIQEGEKYTVTAQTSHLFIDIYGLEISVWCSFGGDIRQMLCINSLNLLKIDSL